MNSNRMPVTLPFYNASQNAGWRSSLVEHNPQRWLSAALSLSKCRRSLPYRNPWIEPAEIKWFPAKAPALVERRTELVEVWPALFAGRIETKRFPSKRKVFTYTAQRGFNTWRRRRRQTQPTLGWAPPPALVERRAEFIEE